MNYLNKIALFLISAIFILGTLLILKSGSTSVKVKSPVSVERVLRDAELFAVVVHGPCSNIAYSPEKLFDGSCPEIKAHLSASRDENGFQYFLVRSTSEVAFVSVGQDGIKGTKDDLSVKLVSIVRKIDGSPGNHISWDVVPAFSP